MAQFQCGLLLVLFAFIGLVVGEISVSGEGVISVKPDECSISFGVAIFNASLDTAQSDNERYSKQLVAAIREMGIDEKDFHTRQVQVTIERDYFNKPHEYGKGLIIGFTVERSFNVILRNLTQVERFISLIMKNGANEIHSVDFTNSLLHTLKDQARVKAIRAAKAKAELYAKELGMNVGYPIQVSESDHRVFNLVDASRSVGYGGAASSSPSYEGTVPIGNIQISVNVDVKFALEYPKSSKSSKSMSKTIEELPEEDIQQSHFA